MPIPKPKKNEKEKEFVSRCMQFLSDENSKLSPEQRVAACYDAYRRSKKDETTSEEVAGYSNAVVDDGGRLHLNMRSRSGRGSESVLRCPTIDDPIPDDKADLKQP